MNSLSVTCTHVAIELKSSANWPSQMSAWLGPRLTNGPATDMWRASDAHLGFHMQPLPPSVTGLSPGGIRLTSRLLPSGL